MKTIFEEVILDSKVVPVARGKMMSAKAFQYDDMPNVGYGTPSPVFVVGSPRSVTTLLVRLIRKYFNINFGTESQFIVHYYKRLPISEIYRTHKIWIA